MAISGLHLQILVTALCLQAIALFLLNAAWSSAIWKCLLLGVLGSLSMCLSLVYFWALSHRPSSHFTFLSFTVILLLKGLVGISGHFRFKRIIESWKSPRKYQEQLLKEIISENGDTEYGKRFHLRDIHSLEEFRKVHPLTTYEHYRSYVERMMNGEENVLTKQKPTSYSRTTGTTGNSKHIPYVDRMAILESLGSVYEASISENVPSLGPFQRRLYLYVQPQIDMAVSGARIETIGTLPDIPDIFLAQFTTPGPGYRLQTLYESNYIHLLFGLRERDIGAMNMSFLTFLQNALEQLKNCWRDVLHDLEHGTINTKLQIPSEIRASLLTSVGKGDPERARELRKEFEKGFSGILKRVWPRLHAIIAIDRTHIWPKMEKQYAQGIQLLSGGYACTEGFFGTCLGPARMDQVAYLPFPTQSVAEFIKEKDIGQSQPKTYYLDEVEEGECYEIVLTQGQSCLYRYRLGDVVKITGFYENCPFFQFMYRTGQILNLVYEKLDERVVEDALRAASSHWSGASLVEFVVAESKLIPDDYTGLAGHETSPYYIIFIQIEGDDSRTSTNLSADEKMMIDKEIRLRNGDFDRLRREGAISHPRIYAVRPDAFDALQQHILANSNASILQYKIPKKLRLFPMVEVMLQNSYIAV